VNHNEPARQELPQHPQALLQRHEFPSPPVGQTLTGRTTKSTPQLNKHHPFPIPGALPAPPVSLFQPFFAPNVHFIRISKGVNQGSSFGALEVRWAPAKCTIITSSAHEEIGPQFPHKAFDWLLTVTGSHWRVPTAIPPDGLLLQHLHKSSSTEPSSPGGLLLLSGNSRPQPRGSRWHVPTGAPPGGLLLLPRNRRSRPRGSLERVPTARPRRCVLY
jgi:hypothetical protein